MAFPFLECTSRRPACLYRGDFARRFLPPSRQVAGRKPITSSLGESWGSRFSRLLMEPLEPRLLLNADLAVDLTGPSVEQEDNDLLVRLLQIQEVVNGAAVDVQRVQILDRNDNTVLAERNLEEIQVVEILTGGGDDTIVIDVSSFANILQAGEVDETPFFAINTGLGQDNLSIVSDESAVWDLTRYEEVGVGYVDATIHGVDTSDVDTGNLLEISFTGVDGLGGGAGEDTLRGPSAESIWVVDGPGSGALTMLSDSDPQADSSFTGTFTEPSFTGPSSEVSFSGMDAIVGGDGNDWFYLRPGGSIPGGIRGAGDGLDSGLDALFVTMFFVDDIVFEGSVGDGGSVYVNGVKVLSHDGIDQIEKVLLVDPDLSERVGTVTEDDPDENVATGALSVSDPDAGEMGFRPQTETRGTYGTFTLGAGGVWTYTLDNDDPDTDALGEGQTATDTFTAFTTDGTLIEVLVIVTGADEVTQEATANATIGGTSQGRVEEDDSNANVATGTLTVFDPDADEDWFLTISETALAYGSSRLTAYASHSGSQRRMEGVYGTFTLDADGQWTYTLDDTRATTDALADGVTRTETFRVMSADGTVSEVVVMVEGTDDAAVVGGDEAGVVTEDDPAHRTAAGTLTVSDPDAGEAGFQAQSEARGIYGTFTLGAGGAWVYTLDNQDPDTSVLAAGQTGTDIFEVFTADGTRAEVVITVTGADDEAPPAGADAIIGGVATGSVTEDDPNRSESTGTLTVTDADPGEAAFRAQTDVAGTYGTFTLDAAGTWTYVLDNADADTDALAAGQRRTDTFEVLTTDGPRTEVVVTVTGAGDAATVGGYGKQGQALKVMLVEEVDGRRVIKVVDRNDSDAVVAEAVLGDVSNILIRTGAGADTVTIDHASFVSILEGDGDTVLIPSFTVDTGTGDDRLVIATTETTLAEWRAEGQGSGWVYGTLNDDDGTEVLFLSFSGVEALQGGEGRDVLVGANHANTWQITGAGAGSVDGYAFSGFDKIVGGGGTDQVLGPAFDTSWHVTGEGAGYVVGLLLEFAGMESITGQGAEDVLHGPSEDAIWRIDGPDSGTVRGIYFFSAGGIAFSGMENLVGADDSADQFFLGEQAALTGSISGGAGGFDTLFFDETLFGSSGMNEDPNEPGSGSVDLDGTVIRYSGMETPEITVEGDDANRVVNAAAARDELVLRWSDDGTQLVLDSKNGSMTDVYFDHPTESLTINLGDGSDKITIEAFGDGSGASLIIRGGAPGSNAIPGADFGGGTIFDNGDTVVMSADAVISTRMLHAPGADPVTAYSIGDSGDVVFEVEIVRIRPGAKILTHVVPGSMKPDGITIPEAGDIELGDPDGDARNVGPREVTIESEIVSTFDPASAVDSAGDTIDVGPDHGLETGDVVRYGANDGAAIGGLEHGTFYFVIFDPASPNEIRLARTYQDARAGTAIDIDATVAGGSDHQLGRGAVLDASGDPGGTAGAVAIRAVNQPVAVSLPLVDVWVLSASIDISGAEIRGGDVSIKSTALALPPLPNLMDGFTSGLAVTATGYSHQIPGMLFSMLSGLSVAVSIREVSATVVLHDTDVISSGTVEVISDAQGTAQAIALTNSVRKTPNPILAAAAYSRAVATAETLITGTTTIRSSGDILLKSYGSVQATATGKTSNLLETIIQRKSPDKFQGERWSISFGVSNPVLTLLTKVGKDAVIWSTAGNVDVIADGISGGSGTGGHIGLVGGRMSLVVGAVVAFSDVQAIVDGTIFAAGREPEDVRKQFDPTGVEVDFVQDTIRIPDHGFSTRDRVIYEAGGGQAIGGLVDGEEYVVYVVDDDTIQLAKAPLIDLRLDQANPASQHSFTRPGSARFVVNAVNENDDAIWLPGHSFATGDVVTYTYDSNYGAIDGLESGQRYRVEVDGDWIRFRAPEALPVDPPIEVSQGNALGMHAFATDDDTKVYEFELGRIDAGSDTVYVEGHGLGSASGEWGAYSRVAGATGLPELLSGNRYDLEVLDADSFRLRDPATGGVVDFSEDGTAGVHVIDYIAEATRTVFQPDSYTVDARSDTITIEDHGYETGDVVFYSTDPDNTATRTVPVVDLNAPGLPNSVTLDVPDPEIGGLSNGSAYQVIVVDSDTIRLEKLGFPLDRVVPIDLSDGGVQGDEHALVVPASGTGGITVSADLVSRHYGTSYVALGTGGTTIFATPRFAWAADAPVAGLALGVQLMLGSGPLGSLSGDLKNLANKTTRGNAGKTTLGATIGIVFADQEVGAKVGESADSAPDLDSGTNITVKARHENWPHVYARGWVVVSEAGSTGVSAPSNDISNDRPGGQAVGVSAALGYFSSDVHATIGGTATLDAADTISVRSHLKQPFQFVPDLIDPFKNFATQGLASLYPFFEGTAGILWYVFDSWADMMVAIPKSEFEGRQPSVTAVSIAFNVRLYTTEAIIESGARINQNPVFAATAGQSVEVDAKTEVWQLQLVGTAGWETFGPDVLQPWLQRDFTHPFGVNNRTSGRSVGGVVVLSYLSNTTIASIAPDVVITIGPSGRLDVHAKEYTLRVNIAGRGAQSENEGREESSGFAFAGSAVGNAHVSETRASIESNAGGVVDIRGGGDVHVGAVSELFLVNFAGSIAVGKGGASSVGIGAVVSVVVRDTEAFVGRRPGEEAQLVVTSPRESTIGDLTINARNEGFVLSFALSASVAAGTGKSANTPSHRHTTQEEQQEDSILGFPPLENLPARHQGTVNQDAGGLTVAASLAINVVTQTTQAGINGGGAFEVFTANIEAKDSTVVGTGSGGAALSYEKKGTGGSNESDSKSLSGAVSASVVYTKVVAYIRAAKVTSMSPDEEDTAEVAVRARREGDVYSFSVALSADTSKDATAVAGSVSINYVEGTTEAFVAGAIIIANGDVVVEATNTVKITSIGGGLAGSGNTGVGLSIGYNHISNKTRARIVSYDGERSSIEILGALTVHAENENAIHAAAVSLGLGLNTQATDIAIPTAGADADAAQIQNSAEKKGIAGAFTLAVNIIAPEWSIIDRAQGGDVSDRAVEAAISDTDVSTGEDVDIKAVDNSYIVAIAGAISVGVQARAFGAALGWNQVNRNVRATVHNSTVTTRGEFSLAAEAGQSRIAGQSTITAAAVAGAVSGKAEAIGATASVNGILSWVEADITGGSVVRADLGVGIEARDVSSINAFTGAIAVSLQAGAFSASISANYTAKTVKARVDASTVESSLGDVDIHAKQQSNVRVATIGVAVSTTKTALPGSVGVQVVMNETVAAIEGASVVTAAGNVRVWAESGIRVGAASGQLSISGAGGFAGGAALNFVTVFNETDASIGRNALVSTTSTGGSEFDDIAGREIAGVSVEAWTDIFVVGIAVGGAVGSQVAVAVSGTLNLIDSTTRARVEATGDGQAKGVDSARDVNVVAESNFVSSGVAGALGISVGAAGVGVGVDVGVVNHRTYAYIDDDATVGAGDSVFVRALGTESLVSVSVAGAVGNAAAVGVSAGAGILKSWTHAYIGSDATVWAGGHVLVSADSDTTAWIASVNVSGAATAAVGVGFQIGVLEKSTKAYIGAGASVTALADDDAVVVNAGAFGDALGFSGADVDAVSDEITIQGHGLQDGDQVRYTAPVALTGLQGHTSYYVIRVDADTIRLAATRADAESGQAVGIGTSNGSPGATHLLQRVGGGEDSNAYADFTASAVDSTTDTISAEDHGFVSGQEVLYFTEGAMPLGGLSSDGRYYVIKVDDDSFRLAATREEALEAMAIVLDTTDVDPDHGHHVRALTAESLPEVDHAEVDSTLLSAETDREGLTAARKGVIVVAVSTNDVGTAGMSAAFAGTGAVTIMGAVTVHHIDTIAEIGQGAVIVAGAQTDAPGSDADVHVNAARTYRVVSTGLSAAGAGTVAVAPAFAAPVLTGQTKASIKGVTGSHDTTVEAKGDVTVTAHAESEIYAVTAGLAVAGDRCLSCRFGQRDLRGHGHRCVHRRLGPGRSGRQCSGLGERRHACNQRRRCSRIRGQGLCWSGCGAGDDHFQAYDRDHR